jgi:hypothetical protein
MQFANNKHSFITKQYDALDLFFKIIEFFLPSCSRLTPKHATVWEIGYLVGLQHVANVNVDE